jgi:PucR C-terminal helix-turn-helix domain/GGDEF-like domain/Purine catabolism regulatory protein-like family
MRRTEVAAVYASGTGAVTARELLALLRHWHVQLIAGESGLARAVTWASTMRARLPAFEGIQDGELALLSLNTLHTLRGQLVDYSLPSVVDQLAEIGASAIAVAVAVAETEGSGPDDSRDLAQARARADEEGIPLLMLPAGTPLHEVEQEVIAHVRARRERQLFARRPGEDYASVAGIQAMLREEALEALLTGTYPSDAQMQVRASQLGYDLSLPHVVLRVDSGNERIPGFVHAEQLAESLSATFGAWVRVRGSALMALVPLPLTERGSNDLATRLSAQLAQQLGSSGTREEPLWSAGLGEPSLSPSEVRRSAAEAHDTARLGLMVLGPGRVARAADLGVYRLLLTLRDHGELRPFVERVLAPLDEDHRTGTALIETLEAFFASNGNLSEAARQLHLHRNSLIYRLNRARELLGHDLDDPELRLSLQLAIKGRHVLEL